MLNNNDLKFLEKNNIKANTIKNQFELLKASNIYLNIVSPATIDNGILKINKEDLSHYKNIYSNKSKKYKLCKFVPASGAASRMFKRLISYHQNPTDDNYNEGGFYSVKNFFDNIQKFAFYNKIKSDYTTLDKQDFLDKFLYSKHKFTKLPKGLIPFHTIDRSSASSAFADQILESMFLSFNSFFNFRTHFTITPEHQKLFNKELKNNKHYKHLFSLKQFKIDFSYQDKCTDTISLDSNNNILRDSKDNIIFRPGGHGALIYNLNSIKDDFIFIKNIDNISCRDYMYDINEYKRLLAGILIHVVEERNKLYKELLNDSDNKDLISSICLFIKSFFHINIASHKTDANQLLNFLNRPVRVCGMVENTGEPGGGPFWVKDNNNISLQIVEKAQIDLSKPDQQQHLQNSTHFNPVDLVCHIKNPFGKKYNLLNYIDKNACFISQKTHNVKNIKVLELPGLWNGAMANWLTIFVEVPLSTFNPVKEINDLLRKEHISNKDNIN